MSIGPLGEGFDTIFPSEIFGKKKRPPKKSIAFQGEELAAIVKQKLPPSASERTLKELIITESKGDNNVIHFALSILKKDAKLEGYKKIFIQMDHEILQVIQEPALRTVRSASPKKISLAEGDLPEIPKEVRLFIESYMRKEISLGKVLDGLKITPHNAREILRYIKIIDLEKDRKETREYQSTYPLRTICLQGSNGTITTFEAYTKSIREDLYNNPFSLPSREYASQEYNYIPERVRDHIRILHECAVEMMALSRRLNPDKRTIFCIGGNTAVGKSRCAVQDEKFRKGLLQGEMTGSLNPDTMKYKLRKDVPKVTNQQVHVEGFAVSQKLSLELRNKALKASMIIDERLGTVPTIHNIIHLAEETKAQVILKDIDGPLIISCLRVLGRDINTDPCVPFGPIAGGYKVIRENRASVIEILINSNTIISYELYATNKQNQQQLVAVKREGVFKILNDDLYAQALSKNVDGEIARVKDTKITEEFIASAKTLPGVQAAALRPYLGKTIEAALEEHSKQLPG